MSTAPSIPILPTPALPDWLIRSRRPFHDAMYAFFTSEHDAIITEPLLMNVPVDDHLVHRGDGVFETLKCTNGLLYCLDAHLDRLFDSASKIGLAAPFPRDGIRHRILETIRAGQHRDCLVRVMLSRGPGSMGISPYDCPTSHLYILSHKAVVPFMDLHPEGARVITSHMPVKAGLMATIKTCNYLPNALLKKEAIDRGADFAVNFDEQGFIAEGATENFGVVTKDLTLVLPRLQRILPGTTMNRAYALADQGIHEGWLKSKMIRDITAEEFNHAREVLIFGTTTNVTAVTHLDGNPVGNGMPGTVSIKLGNLLLREQLQDNPFTTRV